MASITLDGLRHAYGKRPSREADWALKQVDMVWEDGAAYALLGPSGCGKTTLLNLISGLLHPTEGRILFDGTDVTALPPDRRNIAQVFQFPVIYDTMTVAQNLGFPLRNRGAGRSTVDAAVAEIAEMLGLEHLLERKARGLGADEKQKISLGRGLVRPDTAAILFDEPLTVIDPHQKWMLRSKLREVHQRVGRTMIYVTHDQTEALTFADQVVVMQDGRILQAGTPVELFERPGHTFVGHFIGSPGMNLLPAEPHGPGYAAIRGTDLAVATANTAYAEGEHEIGVRPEFVIFAGEDGLPVELVAVTDLGRVRLVEARLAGHPLKMLVSAGIAIPAEPRVTFAAERTFLYTDGWMAGEPHA